MLAEWKGAFKKHGTENELGEDRSDTGWTPEREELNIRLGGKEIKQVDGFVYLGMVTEDGHRCNVGWVGHLVRMDAGKLAESRGGKTSRTQEKDTAEMRGLREEGYEKIGVG